MKIIAFPFAGGNTYSFNFLSNFLGPQGMSLVVLEYPGRGIRIREPLLVTMDELLKDAMVQLKKHITHEEYIIYGHSLGGLLGLLVCQRIDQMGLKKPTALVASGRPLPHLKRRHKISHLQKDLFYQEIATLGGLPEQVLENEDLKRFYEPILKADFQIVEDYVFEENPKINLPIAVLYGDEELQKLNEDHSDGHQNGRIDHDFIKKTWEAETVAPVTVSVLPGNHFFIYDHGATIAQTFIQKFHCPT